MNGSCTSEDGKLPVRNLVYLHVEGTFYLYPEPGEDCPGGRDNRKDDTAYKRTVLSMSAHGGNAGVCPHTRQHGTVPYGQHWIYWITRLGCIDRSDTGEALEFAITFPSV